MSKIKYIGGNYFIRHWFKWYLIRLDVVFPEVSAFPVEYIKLAPKEED